MIRREVAVPAGAAGAAGPEMKGQQVKLIFVEPYFDPKTYNAVAGDTGAQVLVRAPSVGGEKGITDYARERVGGHRG